MELGGFQNIRWKECKGGIKESKPSLQTSGYSMNIVYMPPNAEYELKGREFIVCLLRGSIVNLPLSIRKSLLLEKGGLLKSGENGCLLFVDMKVITINISMTSLGWRLNGLSMIPICIERYRKFMLINIG